MKTLAKVTLVAAGLTVAAVPLLNAAARHPRLRALITRQAIRERVAHKLNLTSGQGAQLKAVRAKAVGAIKSLRADTTLTREQKKEKAREVLQAARSEVRDTFNQEQLNELQRLREHLRARRGGAI